MRRREPTYETFTDELELVVARHAELVNQTPGYMAAILLHEADDILGKHGVEIVDLSEDKNVSGAYVATLDDGVSAVLGLQRDTDRLANLERDVLMLDHRGASP